MNMLYRFSAVCLIIGMAVSLSIAQEDRAPTLGFDLSMQSKYIWRGIVFDENPVLQPDIWMETHGISMTFWGSYDLTDENGKHPGNFHEWDVFLDFYLGNYKTFSFGGEFFYGSFPTSSGLGSSTAEIAAWVTGDIFTSPTLMIYWDIWQLHGVYADFCLSEDITVGPGNLFLSSSLGWGDDRHNLWSGVTDAGGLLDWQIDATYSLNIKPNLSLSPGIHFGMTLQDDIRNYYDNQGINTSNLFFSLAAAYVITS
ncbi:hypothetical protein CEE37_11620 [candidate division LCP-89 bacterium B3_LCP]|uniref:Uncharacterized protein n=1 Tax=candidate division LCP-89 bacterium B3_LCP TaxID=2012998 RepID=A0A532UVV5_UNCL8|nr:MAG: hypothetical protein CEE37_11620 [candidate division LCP-89 bacterium B3_LCP]